MDYINGNGTLPFSEKNKGQIQVIFGPMFSGKSTELMRRIKRYGFANYRCLLVRYYRDNRYDDQSVASHDGQKLKAVSCITLNPLLSQIEHVDVIGVDEGQFFPDIVQFSEEASSRGKIVIVAALDGTFQRTAFGNILALVPLAENVVKLTAVCMSCFGEASFTKRISDEQEVEIIGGEEKYMAVCRACYTMKNITKRSPFKIDTSNGFEIKTENHIKDLFTNYENGNNIMSQ